VNYFINHSVAGFEDPPHFIRLHRQQKIQFGFDHGQRLNNLRFRLCPNTTETKFWVDMFLPPCFSGFPD
jgi:hypothetical protein